MEIGRQRGAQGFECGDVSVGRVVQLDKAVHTFERGLRGVDEGGELDGVYRFDNERDRAGRNWFERDSGAFCAARGFAFAGYGFHDVALACTAGHLQVWELFYLRIIKKGALAFEMPLDSGTGLEQHLVNIIPNSVNTTETDGNNFVVTFQVEAESKIYDFTDEGAEFILSYWEDYGDLGGLGDLSDRLAEFVLSDTLVLV